MPEEASVIIITEIGGAEVGNQQNNTNQQPSASQPPFGPPRAQYVSTVASTPKSDPIYNEALMPVPGTENRPLTDNLRIYPSFKGMTTVTQQLHETLRTIDQGYSKQVLRNDG